MATIYPGSSTSTSEDKLYEAKTHSTESTDAPNNTSSTEVPDVFVRKYRPPRNGPSIWPPENIVPTSLNCISLNNPIRKFCLAMVKPNSPFDKFILLCIIFNSVIMAMTDYSNIIGKVHPERDPTTRTPDPDRWDPTDEGSGMNKFVTNMETPFNTAFICECAFKIIAIGFVRGPGCYLKDNWNRLDFFVVMVRYVTIRGCWRAHNDPSELTNPP